MQWHLCWAICFLLCNFFLTAIRMNVHYWVSTARHGSWYWIAFKSLYLYANIIYCFSKPKCLTIFSASKKRTFVISQNLSWREPKVETKTKKFSVICFNLPEEVTTSLLSDHFIIQSNAKEFFYTLEGVQIGIKIDVNPTMGKKVMLFTY